MRTLPKLIEKRDHTVFSYRVHAEQDNHTVQPAYT